MQTDMTNQAAIEGFFNGNNYPINLSVHQLSGGQIQLQPGQFITDSRGNKVNDPIFVPLCCPGGLSVSFAKPGDTVKAVTVSAANKPEDKKVTPGFIGKTGKKQESDTLTKAAPPVKTEASSKPTRNVFTNPATGVTAFASISDAIRAGLLPQRRLVPEPNLPETPVGLPPGIAQAAPLEESPEEPVVVSQPIVPAIAGQAVDEAQAATPGDELPEPNLGQLKEAGVEPVDGAQPEPAEPVKKWKCPLCEDKNYQHRSQLAFHVKNKHPDKAAEIMSGLSGK